MCKKQSEEKLQINDVEDIKCFARKNCRIEPSRVYVEHIEACGKEKEQGKPMEVIYGYMAKIKFSITDANMILDAIERGDEIQRQDVVFLVVALSWIQDCYERIERCLKQELKPEYTEEFEKSKRFLKAIRSFLVAHPMGTDRHEKLGLDGDLNCADIRPENSRNYIKERFSIGYFSLEENGLSEIQEDNQRVQEKIHQIISQEKVFYVRVYSQKYDKEKSDKYIIFPYRDLCIAANMYIQQIHVIDKAIKKAARKRQI